MCANGVKGRWVRLYQYRNANLFVLLMLYDDVFAIVFDLKKQNLKSSVN